LADSTAPRKGIDILADIMKYVDQTTSRNILKGLKASSPDIYAQLKKRIFTFDDLAFADGRGIQKLLKLITLRDLALSMKGAPDEVLQNIASNMSHRSIEDLREEITYLGATPASEIESARSRIMVTAHKLIEKRDLFINRSEAENWLE